ncbi:uncharacterized protein LOC111692152, partial [Anoplophora glabripennis]|uniref:uncharacterized protein LOC111692152 n=1 Tax=Anoplophora glabripennis TaxID=217634 RepID=UPI000C778CC6
IINENKLAASELLLELMVRIASHPQQWEKVHKLLQKLDRDLTTSRSIVNKLQTNPGLQSSDSKEDIYVNKKKILHSEEDTDVSFTEEQDTKKEVNRSKNDTSSNPVYEKELKWPTFDITEPQTPVKFVNNTENTGGKLIQSQKGNQTLNKSAKVTYPKNFSYHRVTGKPIYLNKNPKAYIAVSVIAPKPSGENTKEEVTLENELHQLKPWWTRSDNFKRAASSRSRWVIRSGEDTAKSVEPKL